MELSGKRRIRNTHPPPVGPVWRKRLDAAAGTLQQKERVRSRESDPLAIRGRIDIANLRSADEQRSLPAGREIDSKNRVVIGADKPVAVCCPTSDTQGAAGKPES